MAGRRRDERDAAANNGAPLPNGFPDDAARLARADAQRRQASSSPSSRSAAGTPTPTRARASGQLANRLQPLGQGLAVLAQRLGPLFDDTTIVVMSEFGRTVRQNGNGGTDHGHGNVMWVLGGGVAGGKVLGDWPGVGDGALNEGRDLPVTTDFRSVLAHLAERHLRLGDRQLAQVFPALPAMPAGLRLLRG